MNLLLISLSLVSLLGEFVGAAPAVTSVHVSFVSGNKKTQYSHGTHTRPALVQYNLEAAGSGDEGAHSLRRRSISRRPPPEQSSSEGVVAGGVPRTKRRLREGQPQSNIRLVPPPSPTTPTGTKPDPTHTNQFATTSTTTTKSLSTTKRGRIPWTNSKTNPRYRGQPPQPLTFRTTTTSAYGRYGSSSAPTKRHKKIRTSTITTSPTSTSAVAPSHTTSGNLPPIRRLRSRVRFVASGEKSGTPATGHDMTASTSNFISSTSSPSTTDTDMTESMKRKDSKAVKRSPYIENFESRGITFPDFDEFGGNEFGALKNFIGGGGGGGGGGAVAAHTHANPESLSPDGVFLPPLPTEASDYSDGHDGHSHGSHHHDPYLADQETAKYAAQHPPFFAAFPHKRTVLDLNERRVEQGLEPNILRSIRPFFAFFDAAK